MEIINSLTYTPGFIKGGYTDRVLEVDLTIYSISPIDLHPDFKEKYIGGRGYALKFVWDKTSENTRFDSPENILVMAGGPLCNDIRFPGSGKFIIGTISPLTETFIDSNIGGHFAPILKLCGFDALVISGISEKDVVLIIDAKSGLIQIVKAPAFDEDTDLGALSYGESLLRQFNGSHLEENIAAVSTGVGAVNTRFGIINSLFYDKRRKRLRSKQAGRGGTGTVMRRKGLRAVIVRSSGTGVGTNNPFDAKAVKNAGSSLKKVVSLMDQQQLGLAKYGTTSLVEYMDEFHILPVNNYQYGRHPDVKKVFADIFFDRYFNKKTPDGCFKGCNLACTKGAEEIILKYGPQSGKRVCIDGPEYETIAAVTCMGIADPQFIMEYNWYCDEYGLDTISMGVTASFLMECFQRGYLTSQDTGYELTWGNIESVNRLLHETALGKGFGKICSQGTHRAKNWVAGEYALKNGLSQKEVVHKLDKFAMEIKGLEFSMYITKESLAQQGGYGFALKGPQHDEAWLIFIDQVHNELPTFEAKAKALKWFPLIRTWFNAVGLCKLPWIDVRHPDAAKTDNPSQNQPTLDYYVQYFNATVGCKKNVQDILDDSERLYLLQKLINLRHGKGTRASDQIPIRAMVPAFLNEYKARADYYDKWLIEHAGEDNLPADVKERHKLIIKLRSAAYDKLCDAVYSEKGYNSDGIPLYDTLEKFDLIDEQVKNLLDKFGIKRKDSE